MCSQGKPAPTVSVLSTPEALAEAAARRFAAAAEAAIAACGRFTAVLAGGNTPRAAYECLAAPDMQVQIDWQRVHLFWGDERCVPPDHPESNYRLAWEAWLRHVPIPRANVHRIRGELPPAEAAADYEARLRRFFPGEPRPCFDWVLLGMGEDGHTASLFPGSPALREEHHWAAPATAPTPPCDRVTLTVPALNAARQVVFLVSGSRKAQTLRRVLYGPRDPETLPAQAIAPVHGEILWLVDADAAADLPRNGR